MCQAHKIEASEPLYAPMRKNSNSACIQSATVATSSNKCTCMKPCFSQLFATSIISLPQRKHGRQSLEGWQLEVTLGHAVITGTCHTRIVW